MDIICLLVIFGLILLITILFIYKLINKSNQKVINSNEYNILLNKINNLENEKDLFNNHSSYRLGDGFFYTNSLPQWKYDKNHLVYKNNVSLKELSERYSNSILAEYLELSNYKEQDWEILIEIVNNRFYRDININKSTDCLMHVRVGDVIDELCNGENFINKF